MVKCKVGKYVIREDHMGIYVVNYGDTHKNVLNVFAEEIIKMRELLEEINTNRQISLDMGPNLA